MIEDNPPVVNSHQGALEGDRPSKGSKLVNKFLIAALIASLIALGVMFKWATVSETPLTIKNSPFPIRTIRQHPTAGGVIIMSVDLCKNTDAIGKLRVSYLSATREIFQPVTEEKLDKGCVNTEIPVLIPKELPPDTYAVKFRVTYDLNPLKRNITQEFQSQPVVIDPVTPANEPPIIL